MPFCRRAPFASLSTYFRRATILFALHDNPAAAGKGGVAIIGHGQNDVYGVFCREIRGGFERGPFPGQGGEGNLATVGSRLGIMNPLILHLVAVGVSAPCGAQHNDLVWGGSTIDDIQGFITVDDRDGRMICPGSEDALGVIESLGIDLSEVRLPRHLEKLVNN